MLPTTGEECHRSPRPSGSCSSARWPSWPPGCCSCGPPPTRAPRAVDDARAAANRPVEAGGDTELRRRQGRRGGQQRDRRRRRRASSGSRTARETAADAGQAAARRRRSPRRPAPRAAAAKPGSCREGRRRRRPAAARAQGARRPQGGRAAFWSPKSADDRAVRKALARHRPPRRQGPGARDAHQAHRRLPADHARRQRRPVADRSSSSTATARSRRSSATSTARRSTRPSPTRCAPRSRASALPQHEHVRVRHSGVRERVVDRSAGIVSETPSATSPIPGHGQPPLAITCEMITPCSTMCQVSSQTLAREEEPERPVRQRRALDPPQRHDQRVQREHVERVVAQVRATPRCR